MVFFLPVHVLNLQLLTGSLCMSFFSYNISYHRLHSRLYIRSCRLRAHWIKLENVKSFHCGITEIDNTLLNSQMQIRVVMSESSNVFARIIMNIQAIYTRAKFVTSFTSIDRKYYRCRYNVEVIYNWYKEFKRRVLGMFHVHITWIKYLLLNKKRRYQA